MHAQAGPHAVPAADPAADPASGPASDAPADAADSARGVADSQEVEDAEDAGTAIDTVFPFGPKTQVPVSTGES